MPTIQLSRWAIASLALVLVLAVFLAMGYGLIGLLLLLLGVGLAGGAVMSYIGGD